MKKSLITIAISLSIISVATDYFAIVKKEDNFDVTENPLWANIDPTYTNWIDTSDINGCSTWTPIISQQQDGFIQSAQCDVTQERTKNNLQQNTIDGTIKTISQEVENKIVNKIENRNVIVTNVTPIEEVSNYNCDLWTPKANTVYIGTIFEQERYCDIDLMQKWSYHSDSSLIGTWEERYTEKTGYETQDTSGTKIWESTTSLYTNWIDTGVVNCEIWTPSISEQKVDFSQVNSCVYEQERTKTDREINPITGEVNIISVTTETQDDSRIDNRDIIVSSEAIVIEKNNYNCNTWSPAASSIYTGKYIDQDRTCDIDKMQKWNYTSDLNIISSFEERYTENNALETQNVEGTHIESSCEGILKNGYSTGNGMYYIKPDSTALFTYCDMTNGGYSAYKMSSPTVLNTMEVENFCADVGMKLFVPRTKAHLTDSVLTHGVENFTLMGIYPNYKTAKCDTVLFNSTTCLNWDATDGGKWFVKDDAVHTEPNGDNDTFLSMGYVFDSSTGLSISYNDRPANSVAPYINGYKTNNWMCSSIGEENIGISLTDNIVETIEYTSWTDSGVSSCDTSNPLASDIYEGTDFTQTSNCEREEIRNKTTYFDNITQGTRELKEIEVESQDVSYSENNIITGTYEATSCKDVLDHSGSIGNGMYFIKPSSTRISSYCDMTNGGYSLYTMSNTIEQFTQETETACASVGMKLFVPRTKAHLTNAVLTQGVGNFKLMGIYPNVKGAKCNTVLLNSTTCLNWDATDGGKWFVKDDAVHTEPNGDNDLGLSMSYVFNAATGLSISYNDIAGNNPSIVGGYKTLQWTCSALGEENI